jgi:hypothetical protein
LELLNEDCAIYAREIGLTDARKKCGNELLGQIEQPGLKFNGFCGDFWAEMAAIRVLCAEGYSRFHPIYKRQSDGTTSDYEAYLGERRAHVEVKNMRANETVLDLFDREIRRLQDSEPSEFGFAIEVRYPYDNAHTAEQERQIRAFVGALRGRTPPFEESLDLGDAVAKIRVVDGAGTAFMSRSIGTASPEPLDKKKFLARVHTKAVEASSQMKDPQRLKVLVINFDSPSGSISEDYVRDAKNVMRAAFNDDVRPYFLFYRYPV